MDDIRKKYIERNSSGKILAEDERLINAIHNLRKNYAKELENRKTVVLIEHKEAFVAQIIKKENTQDKEAVKKKENSAIQYCQATKMDGNKCTAKVKPNCAFCGRHLPK
tara:strand:+ start:14179 stop:14505 length:327 start_codon:yes stop_codon:yes gene_type:complete